MASLLGFWGRAWPLSPQTPPFPNLRVLGFFSGKEKWGEGRLKGKRGRRGLEVRVLGAGRGRWGKQTRGRD